MTIYNLPEKDETFIGRFGGGLTFHQAIEMFPESIPTVKKILKEKIIMEKTYQKIMNRHITEANNSKTHKEKEATQGYCEEGIIQSEFRVKKLQNNLKSLSLGKITKGSVDKEKAKLVPISDFVDFNRSGFSKCIFHNEKTASMKYYPQDNHIHCFSCNRSGDTIDVVMALYNLDFIKAVKFILHQ